MTSMRFEWDENKSAANLSKRGVSFNEAKTVFDDPLEDMIRLISARELTRGERNAYKKG